MQGEEGAHGNTQPALLGFTHFALNVNRSTTHLSINAHPTYERTELLKPKALCLFFFTALHAVFSGVTEFSHLY